tara:strand:- start:73 stop:633 length:561 start_codon:yes stop_codon:yes gene_type:complete
MSKSYFFVICLIFTSFTGCVTEKDSSTYVIFEVWSGEGQFAPESDQDQGELIEAIENMSNNPYQFQQALHNTSWVKYEHNFVIESSWEAKYVSLFLSVDYKLAGEDNLGEGPAGSLNLSIRDPEGGEHGEGYELVTWNNEISERIYLLPVIAGNWTIVISGSGLDGDGSIFYSGEYEIRVETERLI